MPKSDYWYLSGETKRQMVERDLMKQLDELKEETFNKLDELESEFISDNISYINEVSKKTLDSSVGIKDKVRFKRRRVNISKKAFAVGACLFVIAGGVASPTIIRIAKDVVVDFKQERFLNGKLNEFNNVYVKPNTHFKNVLDEEVKEFKTIHWHDEKDIIASACEINDDPIVAFYLALNSLDKWCKTHDIDTYLINFNEMYGTNYENIDDFLHKNNLADKEAWKKYVGDKLIEEKRHLLNGNSNARRL